MEKSPVKTRSILSRNRPYKNKYHIPKNDDNALYQNHVADPDDLLVFGYESKLFPPDQYSAKIRKQEHLIPWNNDMKIELMIDRYDCRLSLHDLSEFDSESWNKEYKMSVEEIRLEAQLDAERYKDLKIKVESQDQHQEEELKRLRASIAIDDQNYNEVSHTYGESSAEQYDPCEPTNDDEEEEEEEDENPFIAPPSLAIPPEMETPATEKMNAVIEKTAMFISQQGLQMEIVLKAKQANNTQFQFLHFEHYLNPYYKHMVKRISDGKYNPGQGHENDDEQVEEQQEESDSSSDDEDGNYLHPSLFAPAAPKPPENTENQEKIKAIKQAVDLNHPLAKLIERGKAANAMRQYEEMARQAQHKRDDNGVVSINAPPLPSYTSSADQSTDSTSQQQQPVEEHAHILPPPPDQQMFVEEIARRVAVEGVGVEARLLSSDSTTYGFLQPWHELHPYYSFRKVAWIHACLPPPPPTNDNEEKDDEDEEEKEETSEKTAAPISFSIKAKISTKPKPLAVTQLLVEADEEDEEEEIEQAAANANNENNQSPTTDTKTEDTNDKAMNNGADHEKKIRKEDQVQNENKSSSAQSNSDGNDDDDDENSSVYKTRLALMEKYDKQPPPPPAYPPPTSTQLPLSAEHRPKFTAVTPSGQAASIDHLRRVQASRRQRALLFKQMQEKSDNNKGASTIPTSTTTTVADNKIQLKTKQNKIEEDIFDLTLDEKDEKNSAQNNQQRIAEKNSPQPENDDFRLRSTKKSDKEVPKIIVSDASASDGDDENHKPRKSHAKKRHKRRGSSSPERPHKRQKHEKKKKKSSKHHSKSHKHKKRKFKEEKSRNHHSGSDDGDKVQKSSSTPPTSRSHEAKKHKKSKEKDHAIEVVHSDLSEGEVRSD